MVLQEGPQVFINFRGELRENFVSHLESALKRNGINAYIDSDEAAGENLDKLLERIEESKVALAILSSRYTESNWCLKELVKIMECVEQHNLRVIPIFYKLGPGTVKGLDGDFGIQLWNLWRKEGRHNRDDRILKWDAALQGVAGKFALVSETSRTEAAFVDEIITHVQNVLSKDSECQNVRISEDTHVQNVITHVQNVLSEDSSLREELPNYWKIILILFLVICLSVTYVYAS